MKIYLRGAQWTLQKTLKLRFRVGNLDLPEIKTRCTSSWEEEEVDAEMCPCDKAMEGRTYIVGESEK